MSSQNFNENLTTKILKTFKKYKFKIIMINNILKGFLGVAIKLLVSHDYPFYTIVPVIIIKRWVNR